MQRIHPGQAWPLFDAASVRSIEKEAAANLPQHTLMQRAGLAAARLSLALAPHARTVWVACGPGNNGGDGFEAAMHLHQWGKEAVVTWLGNEGHAPADARASLQRMRAAGVGISSGPPQACDLVVDALLGFGVARPADGAIKECINRINELAAPVLAIDVPSGLSGDSGQGESVRATATLSLLALKPGLFTGRGRDACGEIWFDDLGIAAADDDATARLLAPGVKAPRPHASHKGSYGDVAIVGGAAGMTGAALLAASGALHAGAGRVYVGLVDAGTSVSADPTLPDLMFRDWETLDLRAMSVACGCGGGEPVRAALGKIIPAVRSVVLDADALNALASDEALQALLRERGRRWDRRTVLTPHPLEAARLLRADVGAVQNDRIGAAQELSSRFGCVVVLKGSGTVIATHDAPPAINMTGNAKLATAGTGDVLAGMIAARLAGGATAFEAACDAVHAHGLAADNWPDALPLTASALARRVL